MEIFKDHLGHVMLVFGNVKVTKLNSWMGRYGNEIVQDTNVGGTRRIVVLRDGFVGDGNYIPGKDIIIIIQLIDGLDDERLVTINYGDNSHIYEDPFK